MSWRPCAKDIAEFLLDMSLWKRRTILKNQTIRNFPKSAELLEKSLTKRPTSGLAYMALGHAFSHEREHDQAFNAYLMAEKEMRGLLKFWKSF